MVQGTKHAFRALLNIPLRRVSPVLCQAVSEADNARAQRLLRWSRTLGGEGGTLAHRGIGSMVGHR